jgi:hypothetical protein
MTPARIGQLRQARCIGVEVGDQRLVGDRHGDHLAAFLAVADVDHAHPRAGFLQFAEVAVHIGAVGQPALGAGDAAEHVQRRGHGVRGRQIVRERRVERGIRRVFRDQVGIGLVDRLLRRAFMFAGADRHRQHQRTQHPDSPHGNTPLSSHIATPPRFKTNRRRNTPIVRRRAVARACG